MPRDRACALEGLVAKLPGTVISIVMRAPVSKRVGQLSQCRTDGPRILSRDIIADSRRETCVSGIINLAYLDISRDY